MREENITYSILFVLIGVLCFLFGFYVGSTDMTPRHTSGDKQSVERVLPSFPTAIP